MFIVSVLTIYVDDTEIRPETLMAGKRYALEIG